MLEEAAGVEGRELSLGERQAQLEKYRFRFVNIYQELEMSSRFVDTHRDVSQGGDGVQLHSHTFYEMIYCTGGSTQYLLGTQRYRLRHGDIVLIPPGVSHRPLLAEKMADPYRRCVVWFSQEYVESVRPMWPELLKNQRFGVLRTANTRWEGMAKLFEAGCGEAARGAPGWQAVVCATTLELLVNIARALEDVDRPTPPAEVPDLFDRLNLFIEEHLAQDVTLERAAREFFVSKSTIDQLFRKKLGISFYRYLTQSRLIAAKERILEGEALGRICTDVGFADYSTFYRAFRREYGVAPSDFRDFNRPRRRADSRHRTFVRNGKKAPRLAEAPEAGDKAASLGGEGNQTLCAAQVFIGFPHFSLLCGRGVCPPGSCPGRQTGF